ncbi:MAG: hypothetical protein R3E32_27260 [Chitinophagales bacterium]
MAAAQIAGGGLSGGVGSVLGGGSFMAGATNGLLVGGLNHTAHSGIFGEGFAASLVTGQIRHIFTPDAIAGSFDGTLYAYLGTGTSIEGALMLTGPEAGEFHSAVDITGGVGNDIGIGATTTRYYYSGKAANFTSKLFNGFFYKANIGVSFGIDFSASVSRANVANNKFILGIHNTIGFGVSMFPLIPLSGSFETGYTTISKY